MQKEHGNLSLFVHRVNSWEGRFARPAVLESRSIVGVIMNHQFRPITTALFVDFDNLRLGVPEPHAKTDTAMDVLSKLLRRLEKEGKQVLIRRSYADWEGDGLEGVQGQLSLMSFLPVYVLGLAGKNSADLEMSLDAQHILLAREDVERFILVAGDRDFIPIVRRIVEAGKDVRVAAFRATTSADLVEVAGRRNFIDLGRFLENPLRMSATTTMTAPRTIEEALAEPDEPPYEPSEADLDRTMRLVVLADRKYRGRGIWLVPFFKEWMNPEFSGMNNESRKGILGALSEERSVTVETREDGLGRSNSYSVLVPDREHDRYVRAEKSLDSSESTEIEEPMVEEPIEA